MAKLENWDPVRVFACKNCRQVFQKDMRLFHPIDRRCPHCEATFVMPGRTNEGELAEFAQTTCAKELDKFLAEDYPQRI